MTSKVTTYVAWGTAAVVVALLIYGYVVYKNVVGAAPTGDAALDDIINDPVT